MTDHATPNLPSRSEAHDTIPRLVPPRMQVSGMLIGYLVDPDGSLLHLVQNA